MAGIPAIHIDLLDSDQEELYARDPKLLERKLDERTASTGQPEWVFIDEVQKVPKLLDHVHRLIEKKKQKFILSGSSARKLKRGSANMLAGRAFLNRIHPLTRAEFGEHWQQEGALDKALQWGTLPKTWLSASDDIRMAYLKSYVQTYLKEEIRMEQLVRDLDPFRDFLEVSAQMNGKIINYSKIAKEVGVSDKTVQGYYQILQDTHLGVYLSSFHRSIRKSQAEHPKFYWFDPGVKRYLDKTIDVKLVPSTSAYGEAFEHWVILEIMRLADYYEKNWSFSFFRTKEGNEIDLVISLSRQKEILVEIKSSTRVDMTELSYLAKLSKEFNASGSVYLLSMDPEPQQADGVRCLPWDQGIKEIYKNSAAN